MDKSITINSVV